MIFYSEEKKKDSNSLLQRSTLLYMYVPVFRNNFEMFFCVSHYFIVSLVAIYFYV